MPVTLNPTPVAIGGFGGEYTLGDTLTEYDLPSSGDSYTPWLITNTTSTAINAIVYFGPSIVNSLPSQPVSQPVGDAVRFLPPGAQVKVPTGIKKVWLLNAVNAANAIVLFSVG